MAYKQSNPNDLGLKILNFSPYAFINVHAYPESIVCKALSNKDHHITQVRCKGIYKKNCISMSAAGVWYDSDDADKTKVCSQCKNNALTLESQFGFDCIYVDDFITAEDLLLIDDITKNVDVNNWTELIYENMPIGKYASYEFLLNRKISNINFDVKLLPEYRAALWNALITFVATKRIMSQFRADRVISYNNLYSCNHIFSEVAKIYGASIFSLHAGSHHKYRLSEMTIFKDYIHQSLTNRTDAWYKFSKIPLRSAQINKGYQHIISLLEAKSPWVYSVKSRKRTSEEIRKQFNVPKGAKVLLATMASGDERFAAAMIDALPPYEMPIFPSQLEWIRHLVDLAKRRPDFYVIIRVHPREFPNKRERVLSTQAKILLESLNNLPNNMIVNWPEDNTSLHDLLKIVDVGLNATSTSGLELLMFGIPVVIYDEMQLFSYPREFNYIAKSKSDYLKKIINALEDGFSLNHVINVFRWLSFRSDAVSIDISDVYRIRSSLFIRIINKFLRALNPSMIDTSLNTDAIFFGIKNWNKLVYAIEKNVSSHLEAYQHRGNEGKKNIDSHEHKLIKSIASKYCNKIGLNRF